MTKNPITILATGLILVCPVSNAAVYKCTDATGKTTFQQQPCPKATSGGQVALKDGDWLRVDSRPGPGGGSDMQVDTDLDTVGIKQKGEYTVARFKQTYRGGWGGPDSRILYVRYQCAEERISNQAESDPALLEHDGTDSYEKHRNGQSNAFFPFAEPAIVAKVCAGAPRPPSVDPTAASGPYGAIYAQAPKGLFISEVREEQNGWARVSGTSRGDSPVLQFLKNLEANVGSASTSMTSGGPAGNEFVVSVKLKQ